MTVGCLGNISVNTLSRHSSIRQIMSVQIRITLVRVKGKKLIIDNIISATEKAVLVKG